MNDVVIKAEGLGKKYTIGHQAENGRYVALRDVLVNNARTFWRTTTDLLRGRPIIQGNDLEEVWALKNVSFEIRLGEAVGLSSTMLRAGIGRNGAGKSTVLARRNTWLKTLPRHTIMHYGANSDNANF